MSDDELAAIEARARLATAGPWCLRTSWSHPDWWVQPNGVVSFSENADAAWMILQAPGDDGDECGLHIVSGEHEKGACEIKYADLAFIAQAREDVSALLAEVRRLRAELACSKAMYRDLLRDKNSPALLAEVNRLRAENERLTASNDNGWRIAKEWEAEADKLRAENEELLALPGRVTPNP